MPPPLHLFCPRPPVNLIPACVFPPRKRIRIAGSLNRSRAYSTAGEAALENDAPQHPTNDLGIPVFNGEKVVHWDSKAPEEYGYSRLMPRPAELQPENEKATKEADGEAGGKRVGGRMRGTKRPARWSAGRPGLISKHMAKDDPLGEEKCKHVLEHTKRLREARERWEARKRGELPEEMKIGRKGLRFRTRMDGRQVPRPNYARHQVLGSQLVLDRRKGVPRKDTASLARADGEASESRRGHRGRSRVPVKNGDVENTGRMERKVNVEGLSEWIRKLPKSEENATYGAERDRWKTLKDSGPTSTGVFMSPRTLELDQKQQQMDSIMQEEQRSDWGEQQKPNNPIREIVVELGAFVRHRRRVMDSAHALLQRIANRTGNIGLLNLSLFEQSNHNMLKYLSQSMMRSYSYPDWSAAGNEAMTRAHFSIAEVRTVLRETRWHINKLGKLYPDQMIGDPERPLQNILQYLRQVEDSRRLEHDATREQQRLRQNVERDVPSDDSRVDQQAGVGVTSTASTTRQSRGWRAFGIKRLINHAEKSIRSLAKNRNNAYKVLEHIRRRSGHSYIPAVSNTELASEGATRSSSIGKTPLIREVQTDNILASQNTLELVQELVKRLAKVEVDRYLKEQLEAQIAQQIQQSLVLYPPQDSLPQSSKSSSKESRRRTNGSDDFSLQTREYSPSTKADARPVYSKTRVSAREHICQDIEDTAPASPQTEVEDKRKQTTQQPVFNELENTSSSSTLSPPTPIENPDVSLLEELFPETVTKPLPNVPDSRDIPKLDPRASSQMISPIAKAKQIIRSVPSGSAPQSDISSSPQSHSSILENSAAKRNIAAGLDQTVVLCLTNASTTLAEADFHRLIPRGAHVPHWSSPATGAITRIVPGRDTASLERQPFYYLFFASPGAALAYQRNVSRIHKLAAMHTPRTVFDALPPPPGFLEEGEDIAELVNSYALVTPSSNLNLSVLQPPFNRALEALVKDGGYRGVIGKNREVGKRVLLKIGGRDLGRRHLYNAIKQDGFRRGILWSIPGGLAGVLPLADIVGLDKLIQRQDSTGTYALDREFADPFTSATDSRGLSEREHNFDIALNAGVGEGAGPESDDPSNRRSTHVLRRKVHGRYVVEFEEESTARRFARLWRGMIVAKEIESEKGEPMTGEEGRVVHTEVLW